MNTSETEMGTQNDLQVVTEGSLRKALPGVCHGATRVDCGAPLGPRSLCPGRWSNTALCPRPLEVESETFQASCPRLKKQILVT